MDYKQLQATYSYLVKAGLTASVGADGTIVDPLAAYFNSLKPKTPSGSGEASGSASSSESSGGDSPSGTNTTPEGSVNVGLVY